jgi:MFS family permease
MTEHEHEWGSERGGSMFAVLRNIPFLKLWVVQALSQTGQNMANFALLILVRGVVDTHGVAQANTAIALAVLSFSVPAVLFSPVAGVIVERASKRNVLIATNVLRGVAVIGYLVVQPEWRPLLALSALYLIAFGSGAVGQFFGPALGSSIPYLVRKRDIVDANALFNLTLTGALLVGFVALGPSLVRLVGTDLVFLSIVVVFVLCALLSITIPAAQPSERSALNGESALQRFWDEFREGIAVIADRPILVKAIAYLSLALATYLTVATLGPEFIVGVLQLPIDDIAFLIAPAGVGVLIGVIGVGRVTARFGVERTIDTAIAIAGVSLILVASVGAISDLLWDDPEAERRGALYIAGALAVLLGAANAAILAPSQSLLQERSPENARARVWAAFFTVSNGVAFLPIIFASALADLFGVVKVLFVIGVILIAVGSIQLSRSSATTTSQR